MTATGSHTNTVVAATTSAKPRLLVVDDEPDINYLLRRGLTLVGFEIDAYLDPVDALAHYKSGQYIGIILDIRMPKMSGFELARKIWSQDAEARICFLTAYESYEQEVKTVFPGLSTTCFLRKPLSISDVLMHLEKHGIMPPTAQ